MLTSESHTKSEFAPRLVQDLSPSIQSYNHPPLSSFMTWAIPRMIGFPLCRMPRPPYETACTALGETKN